MNAYRIHIFFGINSNNADISTSYFLQFLHCGTVSSSIKFGKLILFQKQFLCLQSRIIKKIQYKLDQIGRKNSKNREVLIYKQQKMKIFSKTVSHREIAEARQFANCSKLQQLKLDQSALEVQLPNIFSNVDFKSFQNFGNGDSKCGGGGCLLERRAYHTYQPRKKMNRVNFLNQQSNTKKTELKISYYSLVKMLFPECSNVPPLDINILDTIFFNSDGSMTYIYTDLKKGLLKTKSKNYIELFFKRKSQIQPPSPPNPQFLKSLDYVALLRYKDENFIRLKQPEFKSIFIRPVQANQHYKISNNTLYLQMIPQPTNYEQGTIFTIQFNFEKQKYTELFNRVLQKHSEETSYNKNPESKWVKEEIKVVSVEVYLLYVVYEIYAYVNFHQHKQVRYGVFQFLKVGDKYFLANCRKVRVTDNQYVRNQYEVKQLFEVQVDADQTFNLQAEKKQSEVLRLIDQMFTNENEKIFNNITSIINRKIGEISNQSDQVESNSIFKLINQKSPYNLHYLFNNEKQYRKFINKKEQQLDGFSALTSISNISRKKHLKQNSDLATTRKSMQSALKENKKEKNNLSKYSRLLMRKQVQKERPKTSKWYKRTLNGQKQYLIEKKKCIPMKNQESSVLV